jgi:hypothetical protein
MQVFDRRPIVELAAKGMSARKIKDRLELDITVRQVQRIMRQELGPVDKTKSGRLSIDQFGDGPWRMLIESAMRQLGHNPYICDICAERQHRKCGIHHKRYEGATIQDLVYACRSCNLSMRNKYLG